MISFIDDNPFCVDDIFLKPYPSKFYILIDLELQNRFTWPIGPLLENINTFLKQEGVIVEWQAPVFQLVSGLGFLCGAVKRTFVWDLKINRQSFKIFNWCRTSIEPNYILAITHKGRIQYAEKKRFP